MFYMNFCREQLEKSKDPFIQSYAKLSLTYAHISPRKAKLQHD